MENERNYYRVMLGGRHAHADACLQGGFIGADYDLRVDLTDKLPEDWRSFNAEFIPVWQQNYPDKSRIAAGLACGQLHTVAKGIRPGDIVLCPDNSGHYNVGEVTGDYFYEPNGVLPHRRPVKWLGTTVERSQMSEELRNSTGSLLTAVSLTGKYRAELEQLLWGVGSGPLDPNEQLIAAEAERRAEFRMEKHLEDFLIKNWRHTVLGQKYDIYEENGISGVQFPADGNERLDVLAISKDKNELLVVELKRGRASDEVVGQVQRYMGFIKQELAEQHQSVRGVIIAFEDDLRIRRALAVAPNISFYRYEISFSLTAG
jgi:restriction system protein